MASSSLQETTGVTVTGSERVILVGFPKVTENILRKRFDGHAWVTNVAGSSFEAREIIRGGYGPAVVLADGRSEDLGSADFYHWLADDPLCGGIHLAVLREPPTGLLQAFAAAARPLDKRQLLDVLAQGEPDPAAGPGETFGQPDLPADILATRLEYALRQPGRTSPCALAILGLDEHPGAAGGDEAGQTLAGATRHNASSLEYGAPLADGRYALVFSNRSEQAVQRRLLHIVDHARRAAAEQGLAAVLFTPVVGWVSLHPGDALDAALERADAAWQPARARRDLVPVRWSPGVSAKRRSGLFPALSGASEISAVLAVGIVLPFLALVGLEEFTARFMPALLVALALALGVVGVSAVLERVRGGRRRPAVTGDEPLPPATAIISARLPDDTGFVQQSVQRLLGLDHPDLQVILAYCSDDASEGEQELLDLARTHERFVARRVGISTSLSENVNAALSIATGEVIGVFAGDSLPGPDAFRHACRRLREGADVVQGRYEVRGGRRLVRATVGADSQIVSGAACAGLAAVYGIGLVGAANSYWRAPLLRHVRLRDGVPWPAVDVSIRVALEQGRIVHDEDAVAWQQSAPTWRSLWRQRVEMAQSARQVARALSRVAWNSGALTGRQRLGVVHLLRWRQFFPWATQFIVALLAFRLWEGGGYLSGTAAAQLAGLFALALLPHWLSAVPELLRQERGRPGRSWRVLGYALLGPLVTLTWGNLAICCGHWRGMWGRRWENA